MSAAHWIGPSPVIGPRGFYPCRLRVSSKVSYETIDDAWFAAWLLWALGASDGAVLIAYRCSVARKYRPVQRVHYQKNPWSWKALHIGILHLERTNGRMRTCGLWHVTRSFAHLLGSAA